MIVCTYLLLPLSRFHSELEVELSRKILNYKFSFNDLKSLQKIAVEIGKYCKSIFTNNFDTVIFSKLEFCPVKFGKN